MISKQKCYLVQARHSLESGTLLTATAFATLAAVTASRLGAEASMIGEDLNQQLVGAMLELIDDAIVERIFVLLEPAGDVVRHVSGVMAEREVSLLLTGLRRLRLQERRRLAEMVLVQLVGERLIGRLGEHRLFFQDGQDTQRLTWTGSRV